MKVILAIQFFTVLITILLTIPSLAIMGGKNNHEMIPSQLCEFTPMRGRVPMTNRNCSSVVIEKEGELFLRTAGHCAFFTQHFQIRAARVSCYSGDKFYLQNYEDWTFDDPEGPINPLVGAEEFGRLQNDVLNIPIPKNYKLNMDGGIPINQEEKVEDIIASQDCYLVAGGIDESGMYGYAQAKQTASFQFKGIRENTIRLNQTPVVMPHDSGGGFICNGKYVATIVGKKEGSILAIAKENPSFLVEK